MVLGWFLQVSHSRPQSLGELPCSLPFVEMEAAWRLLGLGEYLDGEEFVNWMILLDNEFIEFYRERIPPK